MSEYIEIIGGVPLSGTVKVRGAKNAALPLFIAGLLTAETCKFKNVPRLKDVTLLKILLETFGAEVEYDNDQFNIKVPKLIAKEASYSLVKSLRASFWVLGPLLARGGAARVALPGGDIIGARPVDLHLSALAQMGADLKVKHRIVYATAPNGLKPAEINLRFPSVGATHQILLAAALTNGKSIIKNAAKEPEVVELANMLNQMGASVTGQGTETIEIIGKEVLKGTEVDLIGDRIEAATYLLAALISKGAVRVEGVNPLHLGDFLQILSDLGADLKIETNAINLVAPDKVLPIKVETNPFPGLATDIQAPLLAAVTIADGKSEIEEHIFEGRFGHVAELCRMGANISVQGHKAVITGVSQLSGAPVEAGDIRAGAALVVAALAAKGISQIHEPQHLYRGYSDLVNNLKKLGANINVKFESPEDYIYTGC